MCRDHIADLQLYKNYALAYMEIKQIREQELEKNSWFRNLVQKGEKKAKETLTELLKSLPDYVRIATDSLEDANKRASLLTGCTYNFTTQQHQEALQRTRIQISEV